MSIRKLLVCVVASVALLGIMPVPTAAAAGSGTFHCTGTFPVWPSTGAFTTCEGTARGVFQGGAEVVVCVPVCDYEMSMNYSATCVLNEPPFIASFVGDIEITGVGFLRANYAATMVGNQLFITTTSPDGAGHATMVIHPPLPTCGHAAPARFELAGWLAFN